MNSDARLSLFRLLFVLAVVALLVVAGSRWAMAMIGDARGERATAWFAPYVDVTLTPTFHFEDPVEQPASTVVLGFVVADTKDRCSPSWGTYYDLDAASRALDLDRRIVRLRERGGEAVVSFGGALNEELAVACQDPQRLASAYQAVIDRYDLAAVDFDIEGAALADTSANQRRAAAIVKLQQDNPGLDVWFTLPADPNGLPADAVTLLDGLLAAGADLRGVNLMVMNFGGSRAETMSMGEASELSLTSAWQQLDGAFRRAGTPRAETELWDMLGATPMVGQNDVAGDVFKLEDAARLAGFARERELGRLSMWSANRDIECGAGVDDSRPSNTCSGVDQEPREFARILGGASPRVRAVAPAVSRDESRTEGLTRDDPRTSPYPLWRSARAYNEGDKVVWQGRVYQAKWWSQGSQPDAPVKHTWETPWRYLGPVLDADRAAIKAVELAPGERPRWSAEIVYIAGNEVTFDGHVFRAKWWTQGNAPQQDPDQPYDHPWEYLGEAKEE